MQIALETLSQFIPHGMEGAFDQRRDFAGFQAVGLQGWAVEDRNLVGTEDSAGSRPRLEGAFDDRGHDLHASPANHQCGPGRDRQQVAGVGA